MTQSLNSPVQPLAPLYAAGWSNYAGGWQVGGFWKDPHGLVHLRGLVAGTAGGNIATLPVGFRPALGEIFDQSGSTPGVSYRVDVGASGVITCQGSGAVGYLSLAGIRFLAGV